MRPSVFSIEKLGRTAQMSIEIDDWRRGRRPPASPSTLPPAEYELLRLLSVNAGRVVSFDTLLDRIWPGRAIADKNLVRIFVKQLRDKLGDRADDSDLDLQ